MGAQVGVRHPGHVRLRVLVVVEGLRDDELLEPLLYFTLLHFTELQGCRHTGEACTTLL